MCPRIKQVQDNRTRNMRTQKLTVFIWVLYQIRKVLHISWERRREASKRNNRMKHLKLQQEIVTNRHQLITKLVQTEIRTRSVFGTLSNPVQIRDFRLLVLSHSGLPPHFRLAATLWRSCERPAAAIWFVGAAPFLKTRSSCLMQTAPVSR